MGPLGCTKMKSYVLGKNCTYFTQDARQNESLDDIEFNEMF